MTNNNEFTELTDYRIAYTFDVTDKQFIADEVSYYKMPCDSKGFLLWYPYSKGNNRNVPTDTVQYLNYIHHLNPDMKLEDAIRVLELRHVGLYSSYKNIHKTDKKFAGKANMMTILEREIPLTKKLIEAYKAKMNENDSSRLPNMRNNKWKTTVHGLDKWFK